MTIESFRHGKNEVFVEVKGVFPNQNLGLADLDRAEENIRLVRRFISHHVFPYLNQYDVPDPAGA